MTNGPIVLVIPPGLPGTTPNREGASGLGAVEPSPDAFRYPPHTAAVAAAALRDAGHRVVAIDAVALGHNVDQCIRAILAHEPALIGVFVSWATREADRIFLASLQRDQSVSAPVVAIGISVRFMHEHLSAANHVLEGEPELAFPPLCTGLLAKSSLPRVVTPADLSLDGYDGQGLIVDLNTLPHPAWDLFPLGRYPFLTVLSSRGCEASCTWCPYIVAQGRRFRACSPRRVVAEIRDVVRVHRPKRIVFRDPAFALDRDRVAEICHRIIRDPVLRPGRVLRWECESRPEDLDRHLLRLMSLAGCTGVKVGLETTDPGVLHRERRLVRENDTPAYLAHVATLARDCARLGIAYRLFVLAGLPTQTAAMARETARFVRAIHPGSLTVKVVERYPGSQLPSAPESSEDEIRAQVAALRDAQSAVDLHQPRRPPRWRRVLRRWLLGASYAFNSRGIGCVPW